MQELPVHMGFVLLAGVARFFFGMIWFHPAVLGKAYVETAAIPQSEMKKRMGVGMGVYLVSSLLMAFVLVHAIKYAQAAHGLPDGLAGGLLGGFVNWLGFAGAALMDTAATEKKALTWFSVNGGYQLGGMLVMGAILALWA